MPMTIGWFSRCCWYKISKSTYAKGKIFYSLSFTKTIRLVNSGGNKKNKSCWSAGSYSSINKKRYNNSHAKFN